MSIAEQVLRGAADVIRKRGWAQNQSQTPTGRVCMGHAINLSEKLQGITDANSTRRAITRVVGKSNSFGYSSIACFNDYHCETKRDAIAALEIAADLAT